jgi:coproporphyrinogen III oxidase-like Fe-S oxidoreductase
VIEDWQNGGFGIYIHWPFCLAKCPYCDFNSHVRKNVDYTAWKTALLSELRYAAQLTPSRSVQSIYFGGVRLA